jgi:hypothetical protein
LRSAVRFSFARFAFALLLLFLPSIAPIDRFSSQRTVDKKQCCEEEERRPALVGENDDSRFLTRRQADLGREAADPAVMTEHQFAVIRLNPSA